MLGAADRTQRVVFERDLWNERGRRDLSTFVAFIVIRRMQIVSKPRVDINLEALSTPAQDRKRDRMGVVGVIASYFHLIHDRLSSL